MRYQRYDLPLHAPWSTAKGRTQVRTGFLLEVHTDQGLVAYGDAAPAPEHAPGTLADCTRALLALVKIENQHHVVPELDLPEGVPHEPAVRHAWSQAVLTLEALEAGVSLSHHLAARASTSVRVAERVASNATIPLVAQEETVARALAAVKSGYSCLKIKVGPEIQEIARVAAVRAAVGPQVKLRLDANGSWADTQAVSFLHHLEPYGIEYVEQPLPPGQPQAAADLRRRSAIPIAADESASNYAHVRAIIERRAFDVIITKPMMLGGLDRAMDVLVLARKSGLRAVVTDSVESAVGRTGALHVAATLGRDGPVCGLGSGEWMVRDVVASPPRVRRGHLKVPQEPGLGLGSIQIEKEAE